jgi:hypothetical protein
MHSIEALVTTYEFTRRHKPGDHNLEVQPRSQDY